MFPTDFGKNISGISDVVSKSHAQSDLSILSWNETIPFISEVTRLLNVLSEISSTFQLMFRRPKRTQYAALCYRRSPEDGKLEILLLTSRDTGRWVIPKGWPMGRKASYVVAETEAREEAGVKGIVEHDPLGTFGYSKTMQEGLALPCEVQVHALEVTGFHENFKEKGVRKLEWVNPREAASRVAERGLKKIILTFAKRES
jgi:8-oxo-dGTP pyrophosphatase MutT (NUDIX family)